MDMNMNIRYSTQGYEKDDVTLCFMHAVQWGMQGIYIDVEVYEGGEDESQLYCEECWGDWGEVKE